MFALSTPQAAATLASTTVGFQIGLFSDSVVNAVLVLIFVSVVLATLVAEHYKIKVELPPAGSRAIGEHVLVAIADLEPAPVALRLARRIAEQEAGVVDVLLIQSTEVARARAARPARRARRRCAAGWASTPTRRSAPRITSRAPCCSPRPNARRRWSWPSTGRRDATRRRAGPTSSR